MGLSLFEFYELTPRQFQNLFTGFVESEEVKTKERWYQTRWVSFWAACGHLKKGTKPDKLIEFPWEKIIENTGVPTEQEIDAMKSRWQERDKKRSETSN